jgi:NADH-quinone oxidoreductase subunit L
VLTLIPLLPFVGFLVNAGLGRRLSKTVSGGLACAVMFGSFGLALVAVRTLWSAPAVTGFTETPFTWIDSGDFVVPLALRMDPLAAVMTLVVAGIGALIHVYSIGYMHDEVDGEYARYFSYLNLFAAFMLLLVLGANFLVMFVGWEGVGLCSYLLIGFWFQKPAAAAAGKKAFVVNRVGDSAFILGMLLAFVTFGTLDFQEMASAASSHAPEAALGTLSLIALLLFIGATGKSAQIPLHIWLPDAMEGPTPVSALIHAATMVTAGVYMVGRNAVLYQHAPLVLGLVATVGVATAIVAATIGLAQTDIKRVLAYSTVSQLGYMFLAMGVGAFAAGIFHLYTHAFFKALLFLGSGAVIHALAGEQDLGRMGGLRRSLPITYWTFLAGALAISGVPALSGFFSKDEILFRTWASGRVGLWAVGVATSLLTAIYMFRLVHLVFHGERRGGAAGEPEDAGGAAGGHAGARLHEAPRSMAIPLVILALGAIGAGWIGLPGVFGGSRFAAFLEPSFTVSTATGSGGADADARHDAAAAGEAGHEAALEWRLMGVSTVAAVGGIVVATFFFLWRRRAADAVSERFAGIHRLLANKYYVDETYDSFIVRPIRRASETGLWKTVDAGAIDGTVDGVGAVVAGWSAILRRLQTGSVRTYAALLLAGAVVVVGFYVW